GGAGGGGRAGGATGRRQGRWRTERRRHGLGRRSRQPRAGAGLGAGAGRCRYLTKARHPSIPMNTAATTSSSAPRTINPEPITGSRRPAARLGWYTLKYRLYALTRSDATVVTYMKSVGSPA